MESWSKTLGGEDIVDPIECPFCKSKHAPRLYGWHERTEDGRNVMHRYAVRCLNCGAQGPKKEIGPHAIEAWNRRTPPPQAAPQGDVPVTFAPDSIEHRLMLVSLAGRISDLSEDAYAAGWMHDCEYEIWREMQEGPGWYLASVPGEVEILAALSRMVGGWVTWDRGPQFCPMSEWLTKYDAWLATQRPTAGEGVG
jgi:hypothetical protein